MNLATHDNRDQIAAILRQRARSLARELTEESGETGAQQFVEFVLAGEHYGIETSSVREVHPLRELTPLPGTPSFLLGVVNIRSSILPVIDIKKFFGLPEAGLTDLNKIIIVQNDQKNNPMQLGVLADAIVGVRSIRDEDIQTTLPTLDGVRAAYFQGVTTQQLILLDMAAILNDERILINETP
jgi:purine-binding chemotaxis protein CheW